MAAVTVVRSDTFPDRPTVLLVHGAANSAAVWRFWQQALAQRGWSSYAIDLRGHGKSSFSVDGVWMSDYADDVAALAEDQSVMPIVMGWSMGGLVAIMVAARGLARACVGLAPSAPMAKRDESIRIRRGVFGPEEYGILSTDPVHQPTMPDLDLEERSIALDSSSPESRTARDDRKAGIVIPSMPCPLLMVTGGEDKDWPRSAYADMPLSAKFYESHGSSHWGLVLNRRRLPELASHVAEWLEENAR